MSVLQRDLNGVVTSYNESLGPIGDFETRRDASWILLDTCETSLLIFLMKVSTRSLDLSLKASAPPTPRCLTGLVERTTELALTRGGFSDVWKGVLKDLKGNYRETVAIKVLRGVKMREGYCSEGLMDLVSERTPSFQTRYKPDSKQRMNREMNIWGRLDHPHVVPLRGYALDEDGTPELISPWYEFGDILSYLESHPSADRKELVRQVARGLAHLHSQTPPVIHGDLKSGNVLINSSGDAGLCDFGLSKLIQDYPSGYSMSSLGVGTVRWCAPGDSLGYMHSFPRSDMDKRDSHVRRPTENPR